MGVISSFLLPSVGFWPFDRVVGLQHVDNVGMDWLLAIRMVPIYVILQNLFGCPRVKVSSCPE